MILSGVSHSGSQPYFWRPGPKAEPEFPPSDGVFLTFVNKWNWAYGDAYDELSLIQSSAIFNFFLIHKKAQDWILDEELGAYYLKAFPHLVHRAGGYFGPEQEIISCFGLRFLKRTCHPWGLLLSQEEGRFSNRKVFYKVSPFFKNCFRFQV